MRNWVIIDTSFAGVHKIITEQMPGSSPRGLVQVLSMVLLSALSSEYFLTWLLNLLWAGTWHRAALAPGVFAFLRTKCHRAWLGSASGEGEAKLGGGTLHSRNGAALWLSPIGEQQWWAGRAQPHPYKSEDCWLLWDTGWAGRCLLPCPVRAGRLLLLLRNLHNLCSWSCCQQGPVWDPGGRETSLGFTAQPCCLSPSSPFASARSCSVTAEVAGAQLTWPVPLEVGSTKLLKSTELVQESRAAQTPGPSNPPPHSRRCPQLAICQQRGDLFLMPA